MTPADVTTKPPAALTGIMALVERSRELLRRHRVTLALTGVTTLAAGLLLLLAVVDVMLPLDRWARALACGLFWSVLLCSAAVAMMRLIRLDLTPHHIAIRMEAALPTMHSRLVTIVDLCTGASQENQISDAFASRLIEHTADRLRGYNPRVIINRTLARRLYGVLGGVAGAWLIILLLFGQQVTTAVARIMNPNADIAPRASVRYHVKPGNVHVLEGTPVAIRVIFDSTNRAPLSLRVRPTEGTWFTYPLITNDAGDTVYTMSTIDQDHEYQVVGGGTWSPTYRIDVVRRPVVTSMRMDVTLPMYLGQPGARQLDMDAGRAVVLAGSTVRVSAEVSGSPIEGEMLIMRPHDLTVQQMEERQTIWFDDDLPADAVPTGSWRWTSSNPFSGRRAHTFNWQRDPYGFTTRLAPLTVTRGDQIFIHVRNDAHDPARTMAMTLIVDGTERLVAWGQPLREGVASIHAGPLAEGDGWQRLTVPGSSLLAEGASEGKVTGIRLAIDRGAMTLDRVGSSRQVETTVTRTFMDVSTTLPLMYDAAQQRWLGDLPVDEHTTFMLQFTTSQNYTSTPMQPVHLVAMLDQMPSIIIERPTTHITLPTAKPLPLLTRAFDDLGVAAVGLQRGATLETLSKPRWLQQFSEPRPTRMVLSALPLDDKIAPPGTTLVYRTVVRDFRGQLAYSEPQHVTISAETAAAGDSKSGEGRLASLMEAVRKLLGESSDLAKSVADAALPPTETKGDTQQPEAEPADIEARHKEHAAGIDSFAQQLNDAADDAAADPTAMPGEDELLRALADEVTDASTKDGGSLDEKPNAEGALAHTQRQLSKLGEARKALTANPDKAQNTMRELLADARATQAMRAIDAVDDKLDKQKDTLDKAAQKLDKSADAGGDATKPKGLSDASDEQAARKTLADAKQMLDEHPQLAGEPEASRASEPVAEPRQSSPMNESPTDGSLQQQLQEQSQRMDEGQQRLAAARQSLSEARQQARQEQQGKPSGTGTGSSTRQLEQATQSPIVQEAMRLARSLPGLQPNMPQQVAATSGSATIVGPSSAIAMPPPDSGADTGDNTIKPGAMSPASIYKLPLHLRQPLLDGMRDRVPEGYQPLIDAYYRQLSEGVQ